MTHHDRMTQIRNDFLGDLIRSNALDVQLNRATATSPKAVAPPVPPAHDDADDPGNPVDDVTHPQRWRTGL